MTMIKSLAVLAVLFGSAAAVAIAANKTGVMPEGTPQSGNCVQWGTIGPNGTHIGDAGAPCAQAGGGSAITIGEPVKNAVPGSCLTVDANGNLAQTDCLIAAYPAPKK